MNNLEMLAQRVWSENTLDGKKIQLFNMIEQFKHPKKAEMFMQQVQFITSGNKADKLAADLMLRDTDQVVRL
jgi:hypothetical protein